CRPERHHGTGTPVRAVRPTVPPPTARRGPRGAAATVPERSTAETTWSRVRRTPAAAAAAPDGERPASDHAPVPGLPPQTHRPPPRARPPRTGQRRRALSSCRELQLPHLPRRQG